MRKTEWMWLLGLFMVSGLPLGKATAQAPTPMADWQHSAGVALVPYFVGELPRWQVAAAAGAVLLPKYEGSSRTRLQPIAAVEFRYRDVAYFSSSEGIGYNLLRGKDYRIGSSIGYDIGRPERRSEKLTGLGDIDPALEIKFYAEKVLFPVVLRASTRHTLDGSTGWSGDVAAYVPVAAGKRFFVLAGPAVSVADGAANQRRFGVTAEQSLRSGLPQYRAGGGPRNWSLGFSATYLVDDYWFINATGSLQWLLGSPADSPIVDQQTQRSLLVIAGYRW